uniref:Odorant receptor n=1 Tax=Aphidius gifuensis TaxID=684658 RepID=A0A3S9LWA4_APHGI|nr:odorant receptor [Aphidius gifuensis]
MKFKATPEAAITYIKFSVIILFTWPPRLGASKRTQFLFEVGWFISWLISILLVIPLGYAAYDQRKNTLNFTKSVCLAISCAQVVAKMLIAMCQRNRFQILINEMENFVKNSKNNDRKILVNYVKRVSVPMIVFNFLSISACVGVICGPLVLDQPFPTEAKYPFSVDKHPVFDLIFLHQAIAGFQCGSIGAIDCQVALLLWYMVARLDMLTFQLKNINKLSDLKNCVRTHQYLLWYIKELVQCARYFVLTSIIMTTLSIIFGGIHIIGEQPLTVKLQFIIIDCGFSYLLYHSAWPAENLIRASERIGSILYEINWTKNSQEFNKIMMIIIQRSQKPTTITIAGFVPRLSLSYYATFLSKTFSFFTTLRIILTKMEAQDDHQ